MAYTEGPSESVDIRTYELGGASSVVDETPVEESLNCTPIEQTNLSGSVTFQESRATKKNKTVGANAAAAVAEKAYQSVLAQVRPKTSTSPSKASTSTKVVQKRFTDSLSKGQSPNKQRMKQNVNASPSAVTLSSKGTTRKTKKSAKKGKAHASIVGGRAMTLADIDGRELSSQTIDIKVNTTSKSPVKGKQSVSPTKTTVEYQTYNTSLYLPADHKYKNLELESKTAAI